MPEKVTIEVCAISGYKATPYCPEIKTVKTTSDELIAMYYCYEHNIDPTKYPIDPEQKLNEDFVWIEPDPIDVDPPVDDPGNGNGNGNGNN